MAKLIWLIRDRFEARLQVSFSQEPTLFQFSQPEAHFVFLIFNFPLLKNASQAVKEKKKLCLHYWLGIHSQSNMNTKINARHE